jgi:hypothetical protein
MPLRFSVSMRASVDIPRSAFAHEVVSCLSVLHVSDHRSAPGPF